MFVRFQLLCATPTAVNERCNHEAQSCSLCPILTRWFRDLTQDEGVLITLVRDSFL